MENIGLKVRRAFYDDVGHGWWLLGSLGPHQGHTPSVVIEVLTNRALNHNV